jgi:hypothetical protein
LSGYLLDTNIISDIIRNPTGSAARRISLAFLARRPLPFCVKARFRVAGVRGGKRPAPS